MRFMRRDGSNRGRQRFRVICALGFVLAAALSFAACAMPASAADPGQVDRIKIGVSLPLSGMAKDNGRQLSIALQLWRDDVNAKGGLLGRPVELICEDDESNPGKVTALYRKLITVDNVDLILGPYTTNSAAAAMRTVLEFNKVMISVLSVNVNRIFDYWRYFSISPLGPEGAKALSTGFFDIASAQKPKPLTVALLSAETDFAKSVAAGARENAATFGYDVVYDKSYAPALPDLGAIMREAGAANADVVFVAGGDADADGIVRAVDETALKSKMFGGVMTGLQATATKARLGRLLNGVVLADNLAPGSIVNFSGVADLLNRYRAAAMREQADPLNFSVAPFGYAAGQVLAQAVEGAASLDSDKLAMHMHDHRFETVIGAISFAKNGEWTEPRTLLTQFQHVVDDNAAQFTNGSVEPILWPPQYKSGNLVYPYADSGR
jgi:branched-chain amino acid transport system substrate-binding protein